MELDCTEHPGSALDDTGEYLYFSRHLGDNYWFGSVDYRRWSPALLLGQELHEPIIDY